TALAVENLERADALRTNEIHISKGESQHLTLAEPGIDEGRDDRERPPALEWAWPVEMLGRCKDVLALLECSSFGGLHAWQIGRRHAEERIGDAVAVLQVAEERPELAVVGIQRDFAEWPPFHGSALPVPCEPAFDVAKLLREWHLLPGSEEVSEVPVGTLVATPGVEAVTKDELRPVEKVRKPQIQFLQRSEAKYSRFGHCRR